MKTPGEQFPQENIDYLFKQVDDSLAIVDPKIVKVEYHGYKARVLIDGPSLDMCHSDTPPSKNSGLQLLAKKFIDSCLDEDSYAKRPLLSNPVNLKIGSSKHPSEPQTINKHEAVYGVREDICVVNLSCGAIQGSVMVNLATIENCFSAYEPSQTKGLRALADGLSKAHFDLYGENPEIIIEELRIDDIHYAKT